MATDFPLDDGRRISLVRLFLKFLRFGMLAFGGPVAQIAMIRQAMVEEARWISGERFNRLLAVMQVLPGPEAHELCVHMGMVARGRWGGVLAGLGFMLPGFALMLLCAWAYVAFVAGEAALAGLLLGVQAAVLAVILRAVARIATHILVDRVLLALAVAGAVATLAGVPFWMLLIAGGLGHALVRRAGVVIALAAGVAVLSLLIGPGAPEPTITAAAGAAGPASVLALFVAGLKGGLLTFGGAYTAIPYVRADTVGRGWLSDGAFLDGVALANSLPAPLVIFGTFVGYVAGGWIGAVAVTLGIFLPAFAFSLIFFERLEQLVEHAALHRFLDGVAAVVVGIIAATFVDLARSAIERDASAAMFVIFALGVAACWRLKGGWVAPAVIAAGAAAGWLVLG